MSWFEMFNIFLLSLVCVAVHAGENEDPKDCDFYGLDAVSQYIITHLSSQSPGQRHLPDDNEGVIVTRNGTVFNIDTFHRRDLSTATCVNNADVRVKIPFTFQKSLVATFEASANYPSKNWINVTGIIGTLELDAVFDMDYLGDVKDRKVQLVRVRVTRMEDTRLEVHGLNVFANSFRRMITTPFKSMMRKFLQNDFKEMLVDILDRHPFRDWTF